MTQACRACELAQADRHSGLYTLTCLACCIRLVLSTHPSRERAASMLAVIERGPHAPPREAILAGVRAALVARQAREEPPAGG